MKSRVITRTVYEIPTVPERTLIIISADDPLERAAYRGRKPVLRVFAGACTRGGKKPIEHVI